MPCTHANNCELYVRFAADPSIEVWRKHFCMGDFKKCVRFQNSLKGIAVPLELLPNGKTIETAADSIDVGLNTLFNAINKDRLPMVQAIMRVKSLNEEITNSAGVTPTMFAAQLGRKEMVELFLSKGCNPHHKCNKGKTAMDYAAENGHEDCVEILKVAMANTSPPSEKKGAAQSQETKKVSVGTLFDRLYNLIFGSKKAA